ncbi:MAG: isochorismatase family protein [Armatimonadetes bacterium]|nr:isochorismatase family protein [Armatimonadota bacterium]
MSVQTHHVPIVAAAMLAASGGSGSGQTLSPGGTPPQPPQSAAVMRIQPRYLRLYTDPGVELAEENYRHATLDWKMPLREAALISIDVWNYHYSRDTLERIEEITREKIAPFLAACRAHGLQVIHTPAGPVAQKHPNFIRMRPEEARPQVPWPDSPRWPPADFAWKSGAYAQYARPHEPWDEARVKHRTTQRDFHELARPVGNEPVILDGEDLHRYCAERGILHLFFIGFNTNACIIGRDYGVRAMGGRGYHIILVRDATTGMETAETVKDLTCTKGTIATFEQFTGYTVTTAELIQALRDSARP